MRLTCNFSLQYPYIIQQIGNENAQTNQVEVILIYHQILVTNLQGNVLQLEGRINNQILGVKELMNMIWVMNIMCKHPMISHHSLQ